MSASPSACAESSRSMMSARCSRPAGAGSPTDGFWSPLSKTSTYSSRSDQSLRFQQNTSGFEIAVVVLEAPSNDIEDLRPLIPRVLALIPQLRPGEVLRVGAEGET